MISKCDDIIQIISIQARPLPFKAKKEDNLCKSLYNGPPGTDCKFTNCRFVHDLVRYLEGKPDDIGPICHIYSTKGFCARGLTCRFSKHHIDENRNNIKSSIYDEKLVLDTCNQISCGKL